MAINVGSSFGLSAQNSINKTSSRLGANLAKLSSGKAINKASDNAAGLAIVEKLSAELASANQAQRNLTDGRALTRVAEGSLDQISSLLARGKELSIQAANGTLNDSQRATLQTEITSIQQEIDRISGVSEFNGQKLLDGSLAPGAPNQVDIQAGTGSTSNDRININVIDNTDAASLGVDTADISTQAGAFNAISSFDSAINSLSDTRSKIGALENRFDSAANNLAKTRESLSSAVSQIQGLDFASELSSLSANKTLSQASVSVLKQGLSAQAGIVGSLLNIRS
jgi:flagellin